MKIVDVQTLIAGFGRNYLYVRIFTDEGIIGIGEAYSVGPDLAVKETIDYFKDWLVGEDPARMEHLWAKLYNSIRFPGGSVIGAAISGIELALWDIAGKAAGKPVYALAGGPVRSRVRTYHNPGGSEPGEIVDRAVRLIEKTGLTALKIAPFDGNFEKRTHFQNLEIAEQRMAALRNGLGDEIEIAVDAHARYFEPHRAIELAERLKPYRPFFLEEPIRPENIEAMAHVAGKIDVPLATGECLYTKYAFRDLLTLGAADILQPDITIAGGFLELKKIAGMAESFYIDLAPHNPMSPLATVHNLHLAASIPNFLILECRPLDDPHLSNVLTESLILKDGYLDLPEGPGWGVELNLDYLQAHPYQRWNRATPYREDGSIAFY